MICPIRSLITDKDCKREGCAWWQEEQFQPWHLYGKCIIQNLGPLGVFAIMKSMPVMERDKETTEKKQQKGGNDLWTL